MTDTARKHLAIRDKDGQPIPGIADGVYDVTYTRVEDGDTIKWNMTATPVRERSEGWS